MAKNVLGGELEPCSQDPLTGFYRDGCCNTGGDDAGADVVCAQVNEAFLEFSRLVGNDLSTPRPGFAGLQPGDHWCLCASRWKEALDARMAPGVVLEATHLRALEWVSIEDLDQHAARRPLALVNALDLSRLARGMTTQEAPSSEAVAVGSRARPALVPDRWVLAALAVLAVSLRAPNLGRGYWIDEGITVGISSHPLRELPGLLREDGSPPLFYVLLHFWMRAFGQSQVATHLLPLAISLLAIPLGYWAASDLFDRRAGLAAAALLATSPFLNWYSTETRMYPLVVCLSIVGPTLAWRAVRDRRVADAVGAAVVYACLLYTHDWGIYLTLVTAMVFFGLAWFRRDRDLARGVIVTTCGAVALWLPWLPSFIAQARDTAAPWANRPNIGDFFADPASVLGGTLGFLIAPLLVFGVLWTRRDRPPSYASLAGLMGAIGILCALVGFLGAQLEPSWTIRYLAVAVGPLLLAAAGALGSTRRGWAVVTVVCLLLAGWSATGTLLPNPNAKYAKSNVEAVAHTVAPLLRPGDLVVVAQTEQLAVLAHYLPPGLTYITPTGPVSDPRVVDWRNLVRRLLAASPCEAVAPIIDSLPPGGRVLEVDPAGNLGANGTVWSSAVNSQVHALQDFLATEPNLTAVANYTPALSPKPFSPVEATLYVKAVGPSSCGL